MFRPSRDTNAKALSTRALAPGACMKLWLLTANICAWALLYLLLMRA